MTEFFKELFLNENSSQAFITSINILGKIADIAITIGIGILINAIFKKLIKIFFEKSKAKYPEKNYETLLTLGVSVLKYAVYFFVIFKILSIFGIPLESIAAMAGVGSIAIGFGAKGIVEDFLTGFTILMEEQFRVGDYITIEDKSGTVESIGLRSTTIRSFDGDLHIFPNSIIKTVSNMNKDFNRAIVDIPLPYSEGIEKIIAIVEEEMQEARSKAPDLLEIPTVMGITSFEKTYYNLRVAGQCTAGEKWSTERILRKLIKIRFEKEDIAYLVIDLEQNKE